MAKKKYPWEEELDQQQVSGVSSFPWDDLKEPEPKKKEPEPKKKPTDYEIARKQKDDLYKKYQESFNKSEKKKGWLYDALLGGNVFAENKYKDTSKEYKAYIESETKYNELQKARTQQIRSNQSGIDKTTSQIGDTITGVVSSVNKAIPSIIANPGVSVVGLAKGAGETIGNISQSLEEKVMLPFKAAISKESYQEILNEYRKEKDQPNKDGFKIQQPTYKNTNAYKKIESGNLTAGEQVASNTAQGVGGQLPAVAATMLFGPLAGKITFATSAQQQYAEQALTEGKTEIESQLYGVVMSAFEFGTEAIGGVKVWNMQAGKSLVKTAFEESIEEGLMPTIEAIVKTVMFGDVLPEGKELLKQSLTDAAYGAAIGIILQGATNGLPKSKNIQEKLDNNEKISTEELKDAVDEVNQNSTKTVEEQVKEVLKITEQELLEEQEPQKTTKGNIITGVNQDLVPNVDIVDKTPLKAQPEMPVLSEIKPTEQQTTQEQVNIPTTQNKAVNEVKEQDTVQQNNVAKPTNVEQGITQVPVKQQQLEVILKSNPAQDDIHTWIRNESDIKTFQEAIELDGEDGSYTPDYTYNDAQKSLQTGNIKVYSSYPIEQGTFVTPSKMEAESYSGNKKVYSQEVSIEDVAWINETEGQYAKIEPNTIAEYDENSPAITQRDFEKYTQDVLDNSYKVEMPPEKQIDNYIGEEMSSKKDLESIRGFNEVGSRKINAYQYDNPEVKPYFQTMAGYMKGDLEGSQKSEEVLIRDPDNYREVTGYIRTGRQTTDDIAYLLDSQYGYSYADIKKGLDAIIKDEGAENNALSKRLEILIDKRLRNGYTDVSGLKIPADENYIQFMEANDFNNYTRETQKDITDKDIPNENTEEKTIFRAGDITNNKRGIFTSTSKKTAESYTKLREKTVKEYNLKKEAKIYKAKTPIAVARELSNVDIDKLEQTIIDKHLKNQKKGIKSKTDSQSEFIMKVEAIVKKELESRGYDAVEYQGTGNDDLNGEVVVFNANMIKTTAPIKVENATKTQQKTKAPIKVESKQTIEAKFRELTGDSIMIAEGNIAAVELRNYQRKNGNAVGAVPTLEMEKSPYSKEAMQLLKAYNNNKQTSSYLYHTTGIDRLESIIKNGLTTGNKQNQEGVSSKDKIYLAANEELAKSFGKDSDVTLRINKDYKFKDLEDDLIGGEGTYQTSKNIPVEALQIKEDGKWIMLKNSSILKPKASEMKTAKVVEKITAAPELKPDITNVDTKDKIIMKKAQVKLPVKSKIAKAYNNFQYGVVNKYYAIDKLAKDTNNPMLKWLADKMLSSASEGQIVIGEVSENGKKIVGYQSDNNGKKIGKSISEIWKPVEDAKLEVEANDYLLHKHNISRMDLVNRVEQEVMEFEADNQVLVEMSAKELNQLATETDPDNYNAVKAREYLQLIDKYNKTTNKPVFGEEITKEISQEKVKEYEGKHPEFIDLSNDINTYNKNARQNLADAGLSNQEINDALESMYPDYVRIQRDKANGNIKYSGNNTIKIRSPFQKAKGGDAPIFSIKNSMAEQAIAEKNSIRRNLFAQELYKTLGGEESTIAEHGKLMDEDTYKMTAFVNGKPVDIQLNEELFQALKPSVVSKPVFGQNALQKASAIQRSLITEKNPIFMATNFAKDLQDGVFNSKYTVDFIKNYPLAIKGMINNSAEWQQYVALGGLQNTIFDMDKGFAKKKNIIGKTVETLLENPNKMIEQAPRFAEFLSSIQHGTTIEEAMYNAAEVTTNFKRGGVIVKALNRNGFNFLNASVQGFDKLVRNISGQNGAKSVARGISKMVVKSVILGIAPTLLNSLLWGDDDDYKKLRDFDKQAYWIVGKFGDGQFIKIPKGRTLSVIGTIAEEALKTFQGKETKWDEIVEFAVQQVGPTNPLDSNLASPVIGVGFNKNWFNGDIVPQRLSDEEPKNQWDESTTSLSKEIGKKFNVSPKKVDYLIQQYTGGIGRMTMPTMTLKAEKNPFVAPFTADTVMSGQITQDFFDKKDELTRRKNDVNPKEEDVLGAKYMGVISYKVNSLYAEKRKIQLSSKSDKYKMDETRKIQKEINKLMEEAMQNYDKIKDIRGNKEIGGVGFKKTYDPETKEIIWVKKYDY